MLDKAENMITNIITNVLYLCLLNPFKYKYNDWKEKGGKQLRNKRNKESFKNCLKCWSNPNIFRNVVCSKSLFQPRTVYG